MSDAEQEALWKHVLDRWDEPAAHQAFLEWCQSQDRLVEAAVRYRGMMGDAARAAEAERRLAAVTALAIARLEGMRSETRSRAPRTANLVLLLALVVAVLALGGYLHVTR